MSDVHFTFIRGMSRHQRRSPIFITLAQFGCCLQDPQQVSIRIQPVFLCRLNQAVNHAAGLCATRKQSVLFAHGKGFNKIPRGPEIEEVEGGTIFTSYPKTNHEFAQVTRTITFARGATPYILCDHGVSGSIDDEDDNEFNSAQIQPSR